MKRIWAVITLAFLASACGSSTPTSPSSPSNPNPTPQTFTLTGGVSETAPTTANKIPGATVAVSDGANAGKSATTDGAGNFTISNLSAGNFTVNVSAAGYVSKGFPVTVSGNTSQTFQLTPNPATLSETYSAPISGGDSTCSDGIFSKPCKIITLPIHNNGILDATLTWNPSNAADLDLTLFRAGTSSPVATSRTATDKVEHVSANLTGGANYELHVTYYTGSIITTFNLQVVRPN